MLQIQSFTFNGFQENTYILYNQQKEALIIDPGMYTDAECAEFDEFIARQTLKPILLLNTHTHLDHVFGIPHVLKTYSIPFGYHIADKPVYEMANHVGLMYGVPFAPLPQPDFFIDENQPIAFGKDRMEVRLTPGHSPGSVCLYHWESNFVISGDVLFQQSIGRSDLPGGNYDTLIQSIHQQLMTLPDNTLVYSGHGPVTTIGLEKMNNPFLR